MSYLAISWLCLLAFFIVVILEMLLPSAGVLFVVSLLLAGGAVIAGFLHSLYLGAAMVALLVVSMPALFALFAHGAVASGALMYGLLKMAIAVLATVIADETMFNGLSQPQEGWVPMIRRSAVFLGICWVLAVT